MATTEQDRARSPGAGITRSESASGTSLARTGETNAASSAALAKAEVEARFIVARANPRDMDEVRLRLLKECSRPGFAEVARYTLPRSGKAVSGPTIRFAEAVARLVGNLVVTTPLAYEDDEKRIFRVTATDLETNATYSLDVPVTKVIERRSVKEGQEVMGTRQNSTGQMVYLVAATDDELVMKQASAISKAVRNLVLRLTPADIIEECMERVIDTQQKKDATDPDAARKKLLDAFGAMGVKPAQLRELVGQELDTLSPAQLVDLRGLFAAIRDGQITIAQALEERRGGTTVVDAATGEVIPTKPTTRTDAVKAAVKAAKATTKPDEPKPDPASGEVAEKDEPPLAG